MSLLLATGGAGSPTNYALTCAAGSYTLTGVAANLKTAHKLPAAAGSYTLSGVAASTKTARKLQAAAGAYALAGVAAAVPVARKLSAAAGGYTLSGVAASVPATRKLDAAPGSYALAGNAATLTYTPGAAKVDYTLACAAGSYSLAGVAALVPVVRSLALDAGAYGLDGVDADLDVTATDDSGGARGFYWTRAKTKSHKRIEAERISLGILPDDSVMGILPAPVAKIVAKVAQKAIRQATAAKAPDVVDWAAKQAIFDGQIRQEMQRKKQIWDKAYEHVFLIAVQEALQAEEDAVLMLMMEL